MGLKSFLCCFKLETGGYVIGWMTIIWFLIFTILSAVCVVALSTTSCDDFKVLLMDYFKVHLDEKMYDEFCKKSRGVLIFLMTLVFVFCICFVFFGYQCVRGVTTRDPDRIKFLTIYMLVGAILCLLGSLSFSVEGIVTAVVYGITYFYFFFVLKSLMQKFNDEKARGISDEMIS